MQDLLSLIYPCSKTLCEHWTFCPCLSGRTQEFLLAPLPRYSCQLHPLLCAEQIQLQTRSLHPMWWEPWSMAQEVTAKRPCCCSDWNRECVPGANLPCTPTAFMAEADQEKAFINISFNVPSGKKVQAAAWFTALTELVFYLVLFFFQRVWTVFLIDEECKIKLFFFLR